MANMTFRPIGMTILYFKILQPIELIGEIENSHFQVFNTFNDANEMLFLTGAWERARVLSLDITCKVVGNTWWQDGNKNHMYSKNLAAKY